MRARKATKRPSVLTDGSLASRYGPMLHGEVVQSPFVCRIAAMIWGGHRPAARPEFWLRPQHDCVAVWRSGDLASTSDWRRPRYRDSFGVAAAFVAVRASSRLVGFGREKYDVAVFRQADMLPVLLAGGAVKIKGSELVAVMSMSSIPVCPPMAATASALMASAGIGDNSVEGGLSGSDRLLSIKIVCYQQRTAG